MQSDLAAREKPRHIALGHGRQESQVGQARCLLDQRGFLSTFTHQQDAEPGFAPGGQEPRGFHHHAKTIRTAMRAGIKRQHFPRRGLGRAPGRDMGPEKVQVAAIADDLHPRWIGAAREGCFRHAVR